MGPNTLDGHVRLPGRRCDVHSKAYPPSLSGELDCRYFLCRPGIFNTIINICYLEVRCRLAMGPGRHCCTGRWRTKSRVTPLLMSPNALTVFIQLAREMPASWVSRSNYCLCWDHSSNVFYFNNLSSRTRRESPTGVTTLQKPFTPLYKLHSQAISTGHQLLCVDFQTSPCSPVLNHSLQTTFLNAVRVQPLLISQNTGFCLDWSFAASLSPLSSLSLAPETVSNPHLDSLTCDTTEQQPQNIFGEVERMQGVTVASHPRHIQNSCFLHHPADLHCSLPTILKTENNPFKVSHL